MLLTAFFQPDQFSTPESRIRKQGAVNAERKKFKRSNNELQKFK